MNGDSSIDPNLRDAVLASQPPQQYPSPATTATNATRLPPPLNPQSPYHQPPQQPYAPYPPDGAYHPAALYGPPSSQQYGHLQPPNDFHAPAPAPSRPAAPGHHYVSSRGGDAKRLRACEACRGLKVRCEPDPNGGPCKRCLKASRKCEITPPSRKRQKKTDSRVSELEKQLADIQAQLKMRAQTGGSESDGEQDGEQYADGDGNGNGNGEGDDLIQFETPDQHRVSQPPYPQPHYGAPLSAGLKAPLPYVGGQTTGQKRLHAEMVQNGPIEAHMYGPPSTNNAQPVDPTESRTTFPLPEEENMLASVRTIAHSIDAKLGTDLLSQYLKNGLPPESGLETAAAIATTKLEQLRSLKPVLFVAIMVNMLQARCMDGKRDGGSSSSSKGEAQDKEKNKKNNNNNNNNNQALHVLSEAAMGNRAHVGSNNGKEKRDGPEEQRDPGLSSSNPADAFVERLRRVDEKEVKKDMWFEEVLQGFQ